ncbi:MAG: class I SAM-dependent methyltransferase [Chloroflexi bacterium]|nr:class I SAM-dependent methyltransferase [Chloroflexota bacterium]
MTTHKFDPANMDQLLSSERQEMLDVFRILSLLPLSPYHVVADIGCGPGLFTIPLAKALPGGKVYALDIQKEMTEACQRRVQEAHLGNVEVMLTKETVFPLERGSLDGVFVAFVLHSQIDRSGFLRSVMDLLKPGGWLAQLNWHLLPETTQGPPPERRIAVEEVLRLAEEVGFRTVLRRELNDQQYMMVSYK